MPRKSKKKADEKDMNRPGLTRGPTQEQETILEIPRGAGSKLVVQLLRNGDIWRADVRRYGYATHTGNWWPTPRGASMEQAEIKDVVRGLMEAYRRLGEKNAENATAAE